MKRIPSLLLACSLGLSLTACDYNKTPGKDPQASQDFTEAPAATTNETDRDSLSGGQRVETPIGKGSAADQKTSADAGLQSAPGNANSPVNNIPQESPEARSTVGKE
ncbi:hypothetical protein [Hymenobacter sp. BT190]|uniref:hypothetical protein n=1 Tax=Hymenobacter sp. BT190 TaxID=2763505 RepID=UPI0016512475|nr:hypothetical protein [Hymenobacter sp. BT190]MBC6696501.1 hypothetical protein [Hymenobacter sp. BT190]